MMPHAHVVIDPDEVGSRFGQRLVAQAGEGLEPGVERAVASAGGRAVDVGHLLFDGVAALAQHLDQFGTALSMHPQMRADAQVDYGAGFRRGFRKKPPLRHRRHAPLPVARAAGRRGKHWGISWEYPCV